MPRETLSYGKRWPLPDEIGFATEAHFIRQRIEKPRSLEGGETRTKSFSKYSK